MLIVESDKPRIRRTKAAELLESFKELTSKCNDEKYCFDGCPRETTYELLDPVEVPLNEKAKMLIREENRDDRLPQYGGSRRTADLRLDRLSYR
jgi:hypothetical protein